MIFRTHNSFVCESGCSIHVEILGAFWHLLGFEKLPKDPGKNGKGEHDNITIDKEKRGWGEAKKMVTWSIQPMQHTDHL